MQKVERCVCHATSSQQDSTRQLHHGLGASQPQSLPSDRTTTLSKQPTARHSAEHGAGSLTCNSNTRCETSTAGSGSDSESGFGPSSCSAVSTSDAPASDER